MFCPKCATNNADGASFCRGCGANISLVPQALTGQITQAPVEEVEEGGRRRRRRRDRGEVTLDQSFKNMFMGFGFLIIAIVLSRTIGQVWWFWMLLPAFSMMGTGIAQFIRVREREKRAALAPPPINHAFQPPPRTPEELRAPVASVTEGTTRHLGVEAPTRQFDASEHK
ncbi:MAG TPA: zinc ribbon domain-containing protein [Pyrinomonadaceae bacterium]